MKRSFVQIISCEPYNFCSRYFFSHSAMTPNKLVLSAFLLFAPMLPFPGENDGGFLLLAANADNSVLASGMWYKIKITNTGIYKLTFDDIQGMGFADPAGVRIYGNGGLMLPLLNAAPRPDDLTENPVFMYKGDDGVFNKGDYILFVGKGPVVWNFNPVSEMFEHQLNGYSKAAYYFVTTKPGEGKRITAAPVLSAPPDISTNTFDDYGFHEKNKFNFLKSGRQWFGERIDYSPFDTSFIFPALVTSTPVKLKVNLVSRSANAKTFIIKNGATVIGSVGISNVILGNSTGTYANQKSGIFSFPVTGNEVNLNISYNKTESSDEGFLDYLIVNVRRSLALYGDVLFFRDHTVSGTGEIARYVMDNSAGTTEIWDITETGIIRKMNTLSEGSQLSFVDSSYILREYVAVNPAGTFPKPEITNTLGELGIVENQNLHSTGPHRMLIVTHPLFLEAADSVADFHRSIDNMSVVVATTNQVYNEFSSGAPDVSAIRDFAKMIYDRSSGEEDHLKYLLLFGDGSYNNISQDPGNSNFILTYQSESSLNASTSYVSDDFFGFMEDAEGGSETMEGFTLDLGVGRLPAKTAAEALALYNKIRTYNTRQNMLDWRNNLLFVGDDEDGGLHMEQANNLADYVKSRYPQFVVKKVLLDAYKQESTSTGSRYPEVNRIIADNIQKGILIYNYNGHGGERGLAAEQILMREDLIKLNNPDNLPLFVTATCEFSRFDDLTDNEGSLIESTSAGETSLLNATGGSIALLSTTRIVYSDRNYFLNTKFYHVVFTRDENGNYLKLGDVIRMTKDSTGTQRNKLNFILLGDPALTLALPGYDVVTDSINGRDVSSSTDTLKAFSRVRVSGHLEGNGNNILADFQGIIYPSVFDKNLTVNTLSNDGEDPFSFEAQENLIYKGKASVKDGYFSFEFMVPKDITYSVGKGKMVYYSQDSVSDANGYFSDFNIGGTNPIVTSDDNGPEISLYMNDDYFTNTGITNANPVIYALISDESGINMVGNGIGHDITGIVDGNVAEPIILNDFFESDLDDFSKGTLTYPMADLNEGWHSLKVKVWDVFNNSAEKTIDFNVITGDNIIMSNLYNYPNPASDITWFRFEHNKPGEILEVTITVFNMTGSMVAVLKETVSTSGFTSEPLEWDLKDENGNSLRQGIYPYRVNITDMNGSSTESYRKLVIVKQ